LRPQPLGRLRPRPRNCALSNRLTPARYFLGNVPAAPLGWSGKGFNHVRCPLNNGPNSALNRVNTLQPRLMRHKQCSRLRPGGATATVPRHQPRREISVYIHQDQINPGPFRPYLGRFAMDFVYTLATCYFRRPQKAEHGTVRPQYPDFWVYTRSHRGRSWPGVGVTRRGGPRARAVAAIANCRDWVKVGLAAAGRPGWQRYS